MSLPRPEPFFNALGILECWHEGRRLPLGGPLQERALLTLLLDHNSPVPVHRLMDAVWDGAPPATAVHQIRKMLADLRRRIPSGAELLQTEDNAYRAVISPEQLDFCLFTTRLRQAREAAAAGLREKAVEEFTAGLELWRGQLLAGNIGPDLKAANAALHELRLTACEELFNVRLELGASAELVGELRPLIAENPLRERLRGQLMLALYRSGRQAEALEEYTALREQLAGELGIDPCAELAALHYDILRGSPELAPPRPASPSGVPGQARSPEQGAPGSADAPCSLPYDLPDFTGRQQELERITDLAGSGEQMKIICLEGMGGSGKTALAVHAAHTLAANYPDGQLCIDLAGFTPGQAALDPATALDVLLRTLGVPGERIPDELLGRIALWRATTAKRRLLILLDNASDARQVQPLLPTSPSALVLITSRVRLFDVDGAQVVRVDVLDVEDSRELLVRVLGESRVTAEAEAAHELIELCARLPLALRICAGRLVDRPHSSLRQMADRLREETRRLRELRGGARSVTACISLSYLAMNRELQAAFRWLSFIAGQDFDAYAAAALYDMSLEEAVEQLDHLVDVHLLSPRGHNRYALHDLVRSYARSLTATDRTPACKAIARLLDHYYLALTSASNQLYPGKLPVRRAGAWQPADPLEFSTAEEALGWLDREYGNLIAAVHLARKSGLHWHAVMLPRRLGEYLQLYGHLQQDREIAGLALAAAEEEGSAELLRIATTTMAVALWNLSRYPEGLRLAERSLELAIQLGDPMTEAVCLSRIGAFLNQAGDFAEGLRRLEQAYAIHHREGALREQASTAVSISSATGLLGQYERSAAAAEEALGLYRHLGELQGETLALVNMANAQVGLAQPWEALNHLLRAWKLAQTRRTSTYTAIVSARIARVYLLLDERHEAKRFTEPIRDVLGSGIAPSLVVTLNNVLGAVHHSHREFPTALQHLHYGLEHAERLGFRLGQAEAFQGLAQVADATGAADLARVHHARASQLFDAMSVPVGHIRTR